MQHCLCDYVLLPAMKDIFIKDNYAGQIGKGTLFGLNRLSENLLDYYGKHGSDGYILKCDVRKYFDNIDHAVLKERLARFPDERVKALLFDIIDSHNADTGKGLPLGNQSSQWFALYYLDGLDRLIKERFRIKYYTRYMDDLVLVHENKEVLKECLAEMRAYAENTLLLTFNEKTQLFPVSSGVDYVGWHFYLTDTGKVIRRLRTSNKRRFKRRLKAFAKAYSEGEKSFSEIRKSLASYNGHLKHGHTWKLRKKIYGDFVLTHAGKDAREEAEELDAAEKATETADFLIKKGSGGETPIEAKWSKEGEM
ncbi:MAG: RNA-directed DNA polymerase [Lachnospiraceae bacterium]|nr:RNA-directed DNA polymerase [Lachnospiraceae bacterium]